MSGSEQTLDDNNVSDTRTETEPPVQRSKCQYIESQSTTDRFDDDALLAPVPSVCNADKMSDTRLSDVQRDSVKFDVTSDTPNNDRDVPTSPRRSDKLNAPDKKRRQDEQPPIEYEWRDSTSLKLTEPDETKDDSANNSLKRYSQSAPSDSVGIFVGNDVGHILGRYDGRGVGRIVRCTFILRGESVGSEVGSWLGCLVGCRVGVLVGCRDGCLVG